MSIATKTNQKENTRMQQTAFPNECKENNTTPGMAHRMLYLFVLE